MIAEIFDEHPHQMALSTISHDLESAALRRIPTAVKLRGNALVWGEASEPNPTAENEHTETFTPPRAGNIEVARLDF